MLSAEQIAEVLAAYGQEGSSDRAFKNRRAPRVHQTGKTIIYRPAATAADAAVTVHMRDLSARGCSFTTSQPLEHGTYFVMQFSRQNMPPVSVLCTVMHCRGAGDQHRVGAEFTCLIDPRRAAVHTPEESEERDRLRDSILA